MNNDRPAYYAIIPASVRYDGFLPAAAKLLYGEISALCNEKGFCWANNAYFSDLYHVSIRSVQTWLRALEKGGYIIMGGGDQRIIRLAGTEEIFTPPHEENCTPPMKKTAPPHEENCTHNITLNNTINKQSAASPNKGLSATVTPKIIFDWEAGKFENVTDRDIELWSEAYPACDLDTEFSKMAAWLMANPMRKKTNYRQFMANWLSRAQQQFHGATGGKRYA